MSRAYDNAADGRYQQGGRRNLIINGAMQVAQRSTSETGHTANDYLTLDRYRVNASGGTVNSSQQSLTVGQTDLPSSFKYFQRFEATTANDNMGVQQKIEDVTIVSGEKVTFSFYAKGTNPAGGHLDVRLQQDFGTGGSSAVNPTPESLTLTSSWQRFTYVFDVPSISGKTVGTNSNINFAIRQPDDDDTTTAWTLDTTGWQVEIGNVATPFEHRSFGEELALCQRYFYRWNTGEQYNSIAIGMVEQSNELRWVIPFPTEMRAKPAQSLSSDNDFTAWDASHSSTLNSRLAYYAGKNSAFIRYSGDTSGFTIGRALVLYAASNATAYMDFNAEL